MNDPKPSDIAPVSVPGAADDPLMGIDAQKWAQEFMRIWSGRWSEVDEALMISWFANAIMRGFDEGQRRLRKQHGCELPPIESPKPAPAEAPKAQTSGYITRAKPAPAPVEKAGECAHEWFQTKESCYWNCQKCGALRPYDPSKRKERAEEYAEENAHHAHGPLGILSRAYLALRAELAAAKEEIERLEGCNEDLKVTIGFHEKDLAASQAENQRILKRLAEVSQAGMAVVSCNNSFDEHPALTSAIEDFEAVLAKGDK